MSPTPEPKFKTGQMATSKARVKIVSAWFNPFSNEWQYKAQRSTYISQWFSESQLEENNEESFI